MNDSELNIYRAIKAPVLTKLEEILKLLKNIIKHRGKMHK